MPFVSQRHKGLTRLWQRRGGIAGILALGAAGLGFYAQSRGTGLQVLALGIGLCSALFWGHALLALWLGPKGAQEAAQRRLSLALEDGWQGRHVLTTAALSPPSDADLHAAFDRGEFIAYFQPQLSTDTGAVSGLEVLARWRHPEVGLMLPARFLPLLATSALRRRLTAAMCIAGLQALQAWRAAGINLPGIAVNVTADDLGDAAFAGWIALMLQHHGCNAAEMTIEVLETVVGQPDAAQIAATLRALDRLGCRIDLDDFGSGPAALQALCGYSIQRIKLDRSLIAGVAEQVGRQRLVAGIVALAEHLGLEVLAEGVESAAEHGLLAQLGCGHVQGYRIAHPMPFAAVHAWLQNNAGPPDAMPSLFMRRQ